MAVEKYRIEFRPAALRELERIDKKNQNNIFRKIKTLAANPRPSGVRKLAAEEDFWRVRAGDFRIVYCIEEERVVVLILRVGHRSSVYRRLPNAP